MFPAAMPTTVSDALRRVVGAVPMAAPRAIAWGMACALLALAQIPLAGYTFGFGNQALQIAHFKRLLSPGLYPGDAALNTFNDYPTQFFRALAALVPSMAAMPGLYLTLHALVAAAVLGAAAALVFAAFGRRSAAWLVPILLVAGHHAGLGEASLYSPGLTHTWFAFPLALLAVAAALHGWHLAACALAAGLFQIHALAALGVAGMVFAVLAGEGRKVSRVSLVVCLAALAAGAMPFVAGAVFPAHVYDDRWVALLRIRSAHHAFPSTWWTPGVAQAPRFALAMGFMAVAISAAPARVGRGRRLAWALGAAAVLMVAAVLGSEVWPVPAVLRAQPFRVTRVVTVLALAAVANWCAAAVGEACIAGSHARGLRVAGAIVAVAVTAAFAVPGLEDWWPILLLAAAGVELARGRVAWWAATAVGIAGACVFLAWGQIGFSLAPSGPPHGLAGLDLSVSIEWVAPLLAGLACAGLAVLPRRASWVSLLALLAAPVLARSWSELHGRTAAASPDGRAWMAVQGFAREHTATNAVFLVPPRVGGFRVYSERAVVAEWRDGTQQFFSPAYAAEWWQRMQDLEPGLAYSPDGRRQLSAGAGIETLSPDAAIALCQRYGADYLVLPRTEDGYPLVGVYSNAQWLVCRPQTPPPPPCPAGIADTNAWLADVEFVARVVRPNIEKHRKSDLTVRLTLPDGRPLQGAAYRLEQRTSAFKFGSVLPFFRPLTPGGRPDFHPGLADTRELEAFARLFDFSVIGYSGKWNVMEPEEGRPSYEDLDAYVAWCVEHGVTPEFHFVSGYEPAWLKAKPPEQQRECLLDRARCLVERYGDRIPYWQVVNEKHLFPESLDTFRLFRELRPDLRIGISDCARFFSDQTGPRRQEDLLRGLREVRWLRERGIALDFFAFHGHRPFGVWPEARTMYEALDAFAAEGVRLHITEAGLHTDRPLIGPIRQGKPTPELQSEYYLRFFTICFSHPAVDAVNLWGMGPRTWMNGAGLLDAEYRPKPAYEVLRRAIREEWRTRSEGRTPLDGRLVLRAFHGDYELAVTPPGALNATTASLTVKSGATNDFVLVWDSASGVLRARGPTPGAPLPLTAVDAPARGAAGQAQ
jgi:GH35 family endo-1,4-beta-xylanase